MKTNRKTYGIFGWLIAGIVVLTPVVSGPSAQGPQELDGVVLTEVAPRVLTPNGDLLNDVIYFKFDSTLAGLPIDSAVYDINGAKVSNLALDSSETSLTWNGRDESGRTVPSGIYIYAISLGKKRATGTVVIAR